MAAATSKHAVHAELAGNVIGEFIGRGPLIDAGMAPASAAGCWSPAGKHLCISGDACSAEHCDLAAGLRSCLTYDAWAQKVPLLW